MLSCKHWEPRLDAGWLSAATGSCVQGDSLRHIGDAAGSQLATAQSRVEQLQQQLQAKEEQLKETKVCCVKRYQLAGFAGCQCT